MSYIGLVMLGLTLLFGMGTGFHLFFRLAYVLALVLVVGFLWARFGLLWVQVHVERRGARAQVGDRLEGRITVRNTGLLPKGWLEARDLSDVPGYSNGMAFSLPSRGFRSWKASTVVRRRGLYRLGPIEVAASDPFGLFHLRQKFLGQQELLVYPATVPVPAFRAASAVLAGEGPVRQRTYAPTPHASSVREYQPTDSLKRIHWPTTARVQRLMVKEFDDGMAGHLWLVLDLHAAVQAGKDIETTEEYLVSAAASIAREYLAANVPVGLIAYGELRYIVRPQRGLGHLVQLMEHLARARAFGETPLAEVIARESAHFTQVSSMVVLTPSWQQEWTLALGELAKRRVRLTAVLADAVSFGGSGDIRVPLGLLDHHGVPTYLVRQGQPLSQALAGPYVAVAPAGLQEAPV
ncbi:MAG: DUF58 domain-containing protein [Chloroflexi bacterium]|nr:DUF58 domain-containing protein [Chloroflexota bacterium]